MSHQTIHTGLIWVRVHLVLIFIVEVLHQGGWRVFYKFPRSHRREKERILDWENFDSAIKSSNKSREIWDLGQLPGLTDWSCSDAVDWGSGEDAVVAATGLWSVWQRLLLSCSCVAGEDEG
ncbi:hypothetical protein TB2_016616 [Malus domestica]